MHYKGINCDVNEFMVSHTKMDKDFSLPSLALFNREMYILFLTRMQVDDFSLILYNYTISVFIRQKAKKSNKFPVFLEGSFSSLLPLNS